MASITVDLEDAERTGLISPRQAAALRSSSNPNAHDEPVQVSNRFSEVFVAIGCAILLHGLYAVIAGGAVPAVYAALSQVLVAWLLAELLHRRRMGFATGFCVLLAAYAAHKVAYLWAAPAPRAPGNGYRGFLAGSPVADLSLMLAISAAVVAAGLARFRIPFLVLPSAALAAGAIADFLASKGRLDTAPLLVAIGITGACLIATGIWADRKDPERKGKPSQFAFWLFVAGSPLTVHPFLILAFTQMKDLDRALVAAVIIAISMAVTLGGLVLDRRAPVVSTLVYVTVAVGYLLNSPGVATLMIGLYVLALGIMWKPARRLVEGAMARRGRPASPVADAPPAEPAA